MRVNPEWEKPGYAAWVTRAHRDLAEPFISVYYRIRINQVTGHEATRDAKDAIFYAASPPPAGR